MTNQQVSQCHAPTPATFQESSKPTPEKDNSDDFKPPSPPASSGAASVKCLAKKKIIRISVKIEAGKRHDEIEEFMLEGDDDCGETIERHDALVVGRPEGLEECGGYCEERKVFYVGITA